MHDADGWKEAMDKNMAKLKSHDVHKLVPWDKGLQTLKLGWACAGRSEKEFLTKIRQGWSPKISINALGLTTVNQFHQ